MNSSHSGRWPAKLVSALLVGIAGGLLVGVLFTHMSLQPVVEDLQSWMSDRDANLTRMGIDPALSESEIADAMTQKLVDDPGLLDETQSSLERRSRIYDQVNDRPLLAAGCYLLGFRSPADTVAVAAKSGTLVAYWPAFLVAILLVTSAIATLLWKPAMRGEEQPQATTGET